MSARDSIPLSRAIPAEEARRHEENLLQGEASKIETIAGHLADVEPSRTESELEPVISCQSDLQSAVDNLETRAQEQKPLEPLVFGSNDVQSLINERPLGAEPLHESSVKESDEATVMQLDASPTEPIENHTDDIVTEHDLGSSLFDHSIETESSHTLSSTTEETVDDRAEFAGPTEEPVVSTEEVLSPPEGEPPEHAPAVFETNQTAETQAEDFQEEDAIDKSAAIVPTLSPEGSDNAALSDEGIEEHSDFTEAPLQDPHQAIDGEKEIGTSAPEQSIKKKKRQQRYRPPIRTGEVNRSTPRGQFAGTQSPQSRSLSMSVHARPLTHRRNQWRVSLIPPRAREFPEEITIKSVVVSETWYARQDEWYEGLTPPNLGDLLASGGRWESDDERFNWVLSPRDIYVLAPNSTISGFVNTSTLALGQDHVVLCTNRQKEAVQKALLEAGAEVSSIISGNGIPDGWLLFDNIRPSVAIEHSNEAGIFNALRPIHALRISFEGGIRLSGTTWLNRYPPKIRIAGESVGKIAVQIDGRQALLDSNGNYIAPKWDTEGKHRVFCGGVSESYELNNGAEAWEMFEAYSYKQDTLGENPISICGPIVFSMQDNTEVSLIPSNNNCLIGSIPGEINLISQSSVLRTSTLLAQASFPVVWSLPADPLRCNKATSSVRLLKSLPPGSPPHMSHPRDRWVVLRWCQSILNASRKGLRIYPDTEDAKGLWQDYKVKARELRRKLR